MPNVAELIKEKKIDDLKKLDSTYDSYNQALGKFDYLQSVSESSIFTAYHQALLHDNELWFHKEMTHENKEMFYRLKFRAMNSGLKKDLHHITTLDTRI